MKTSDITDIIIAAFVVGGIFVFTRNKNGVRLIRATGGAFSGLLKTSEGR